MYKSVDGKKNRAQGMAIIACLLFSLGMLGSGCESDGWKVSSSNFSEQNLCQEASRMLCNDLYTCCTQAEIEETLQYEISSERSDCMRDVERACTRDWHPHLAALEMGTAVLDTAATNACWNDRFRPLDACVDYTELESYDDPCADLFLGALAITGLVEVGGDCFSPVECEERAVCDMKNFLCILRPEEGERCLSGGLCADGFYCRPEFICTQILSVGEACTSSQSCGEGHYCEFSLPSPVCTPKKADGEECDPDASWPGECENSCITSPCLDAPADGGVCVPDSACGVPSIPHVTDYCDEALSFVRTIRP